MGLKTDIAAAIVANTTAGQKNRIIAAFSSAYGYSATLPDNTPNPETAAQFTARKIAEYVMEITRSEEIKTAHAAVASVNAIAIN